MICILLVLLIYVLGNIYWHKEIVYCKWIYTIYSTIIVLFYIIFVLIILSLV